jgi:phosphate:Na+ symporter
MIHSGILRAFGGDLRRILMRGLNSRWKAFLAGLGITALLQSSTATGLMTQGFVSSGLMTLGTAIAVMLGANVGTTLIVQVLTFNIAALAPVLVLVGLIAFKRGRATRVRDIGRVIIGLGLLLLALHLVLAALRPVENAQGLRDLFSMLASDPLMNIAIAALLTWAAHSSVAIVLFVMTLAASGIIPMPAALALVLGANLGSIIPQYFAVRGNADARRLILANLVVRGVGCVAAVPFLPWIATAIARLDPDTARQVADFHTLFNLVLSLAFLALLNPLAQLCTRLLPAPQPVADPAKPRYLDAAMLDNPAIALSNAEREVLRMIDVVEAMLHDFLAALENSDRKRLSAIAAKDDILDKLHGAIKMYLTRLGRENALSETDAKRGADIVGFAINLEHVGDILDKNLRELAAKKIKNRLSFSSEGFAEIKMMHQEALDNLKLATSVFLSGDATSARRLLGAKVRIRNLEATLTGNHLRRLREGRPESLETSTLHIDIARDLKRITAHEVAVAYPILEAQGALRPSRLRDSEPTPAAIPGEAPSPAR